MSKTLKYFIVFILSFLAIFFDFDNLNILLTIPLLTFFMFNGIASFLISFSGLACGSLLYYFINESYLNSIYLLIGLCIYFVIYHFSLFIHRKLIINYLTSNILAIILSYLIYQFSYENFNIYNFTIVLLLGCLLTLLFSYLLKKFSFYLFTFQDDKAKVLALSLTIIYFSLINNIISSKFLLYTSIGLITLLLLIFALKNNTINVLAINSVIILFGLLYNIPILYEYLYITLITSIGLSINSSKHTYLNSLFILAIFIAIYFIKKINDFYYYLSMALIVSLFLLFIKKKNDENIENQYYRLYVDNKDEMLEQLNNFQKMFLTLSENFNKSRISKILEKTKKEVFDKLCSNCPEIDNCHKKGKHLLLNYINDSLNNTLTDDKIRYIRQNCLKQEIYFSLLDKFTTTYLINNYQKQEDAKMKDIIATDFYSFSKIMEQCSQTFNNDRLLISNNFYKNLKNILEDYQYDVLFINNLSNENKYQFDIAIKNITVKEIKEVLLPIINNTLQTCMMISHIDNATLSSSYFIISIIEIENLKIDYAIKQSNEDVKANGDSFTTLKNKNLFFLAISDGMGHGLEANEESKFTLDTLRAMLKTNMDIKTAINLVNDIIQLKNDLESYTTLDLLAINMKKKIASFYKLGAFNAYIIRNHQVTEVNNYSLPLGIVSIDSPSPSSYIIEKGDIIVMCSDGMIDDTNRNIHAILEDLSMDLPATMCNVLFSQLISIRQNADDATLAIITIN